MKKGLKPVVDPKNKYCLKGHIMERLTTNPYASEGVPEVICDKCNKEIRVNNGFYHCKQCCGGGDSDSPCDYHSGCCPK